MIISFVIFLVLFAIVGVSSSLKSRKNKRDYYLASSSIPSPLVGLSAVATNNSGYMFIGVIGYTYATGLAAVWLMVGWILGDYLGSLYIHSKLRIATERTNEVTYAGVLSNWHGGSNKKVQKLIAGITLLFLLAYSSAQLIAGSKALYVLLGWPHWAGAVIGAALVTLYCISGGIRASIWTDAVQSIVMIVAMFILLWSGVANFGGVNGAIEEMGKVSGFLNWFPTELALPGAAGMIMFVVGWMFAGLSVVGQPHIMIRFMTLSDSKKINRARAWYYIFFILFYCMSTGVGLLSRIYLDNPATFDSELALPTMAKDLLPDVLVGLILAGIFAATISTADSLVLSCSSAVTHDLLPVKLEKSWMLKAGTGVITVVALVLALYSSQSVFHIVLMSWSALAGAFSPLLIFLALGGKTTQSVSIVAIIGGLAATLLWRYFDLHLLLYEGLPGILLGLAVLYGSKLIGTQKG